MNKKQYCGYYDSVVDKQQVSIHFWLWTQEAQCNNINKRPLGGPQQMCLSNITTLTKGELPNRIKLYFVFYQHFVLPAPIL